MSRVTRINIEEELAAARRGECLACRIGARHADGSPCPRAKYWNDAWCAKGGHDFDKRPSFDCYRIVLGRCRWCGQAAP